MLSNKSWHTQHHVTLGRTESPCCRAVRINAESILQYLIHDDEMASPVQIEIGLSKVSLPAPKGAECCRMSAHHRVDASRR